MADVQEYKCPNCGGALAFDSGIQKMKCPYCDSEFEMEELQKLDADLDSHENDMNWQAPAGAEWSEGEADNMRVYICQSCAGEIVADENTGATACPYCGNPVVIKGSFAGDLRPDLIIPFKLDKEAAKRALKKHLTKKVLLPKAFKTENHIDELKGVYVPFWLFDADAAGKANFKATKVRHWSDKDYNYTETSYYAVHRAGTMGFNAIPVDGSSKMPDDLMESIEPYDLSQSVDFQTAYMAGYLADKYDVGVDASAPRANERIRASMEDALRDTVHGFTTVTPESCQVSLSNGVSHYALYPVWLLTTTWRDKHYLFAMNGQTGKFVGDLPMNKRAFALWLGGITAGIGALSYLIAYLLH